MEVYQVIQGPARVPAGTILQLSDTQARSRTRQLRPLELSWFIALTDLFFETGDVLTFCSPLDAVTLAAFLPPELQMPRAYHPNQRPKPEQEK